MPVPMKRSHFALCTGLLGEKANRNTKDVKACSAKYKTQHIECKLRNVEHFRAVSVNMEQGKKLTNNVANNQSNFSRQSMLSQSQY